jgi:predicted nucleotidyltransferase
MRIDIFIRTPEQKILSLFAMDPDRALYGREISRKLGLSPGAVHAALNSLEKQGMLDPERIGRTKLYRSRPSDPIFRTFRVFNTLLSLDPLVEAVKGISRQIILFGSCATGDFASSSDLDLFVVSEEKQKILTRVSAFERKFGREIRPIIMDQIEWMKLEAGSPEFFDELSRGLVLWEKPVDESGF